MSSSTSSTRSPGQELDRQIARRPDVTRNDALGAIVAWIIALVTALRAHYLHVIEDLKESLSDDHEGLSATVQTMSGKHDLLVGEFRKVQQATTAHGLSASLPSGAATMASSTGHLARCSKCHARGHVESECKSTNPSAVRRRVAQNQKVRARRRQLPGESAPLPPSVPYPTSAFVATSPYAPGSTYYPAPNIVAEAAELCRCIAQSNRDRRRHRAATSNAAPA